MDLKCKQETVFTCDYSDFNEWIEQELGQPFELVADQESGNDTTIELHATAEPYHVEYIGEPRTDDAAVYVHNPDDWKRVPGMPDYDLDTVRKFQETGEYFFAASTLLQYLVTQGKAEPGTYMVRVCW
jgi:hypothetical protein